MVVSNGEILEVEKGCVGRNVLHRVQRKEIVVMGLGN